MKVLHLCRTFSKVSETFVYDVITELDTTGLENKVLTFRRENVSERPFSKVVVLKPSLWQQVTKRVKKVFGLIGLHNYSSSNELAVIRGKLLYRFLKQERPDILHAHFGLQGLMAFPYTSKLNIPLVVSFHGYDAFRLPENPELLRKLQALFQHAAAITVVSNYMKNHLVGLGCPLAKLHLIHVGKRISDYAYKNYLGAPMRNFLSIGRLCEKKGFLDCIGAFSLLVGKYPELKLNIVGSGEMEPEIIRLVAEKKLTAHVTLLGSLQHRQVIEALSEADAFILCSKTSADGDKEGIPTVLMEAQAMGLPCVSTIHSGIPEIFPDTGKFLLAKEGDVKDIASKIEDLINALPGQIIELKQAGRAIVESEFNLKDETAKLTELFYSLKKQ